MSDSGYSVVLGDGGLEFRGDNRKLISCRDHEVVLSGPSETGKSFVCCTKLHLTCLKYPGSQHAMVRKTFGSIAGTVGKTFERVYAGAGVNKYGGEVPSRYIYPNGSTVWVGGMDNADKVLSAERDTIYVCQAEELSLNEWETLMTRCTGRGATVKWPQLFGDCNPAGSQHWIVKRAKEGKLTLLKTMHADNPSLFDAKGQLTEQGKRSMAVLENLSGVRRKRLRDGIWATAEGAVYDNYDPQVHAKARSRAEMKRKLLTVDVGFTNPAVILDIGEDGDGRWHCFREFYRTGVLPIDHAQAVRDWWNEGGYELCVVDAAAAGFIATLVDMGVNAIAGKGTVLGKGGSGGIQAIQNRLKVQADGLPRFTHDPSCVNLQNEFESYTWKPGQDVPVKEFDHALDALRYLDDQLAEPDGSFRNADGFRVGHPQREALAADRLAPDQFASLIGEL